MKNVVKESKPQVEPHVITSRNSPELAQRIRQASAAILKRNYNLYKELENKCMKYLKIFNLLYKLRHRIKR